MRVQRILTHQRSWGMITLAPSHPTNQSIYHIFLSSMPALLVPAAWMDHHEEAGHGCMEALCNEVKAQPLQHLGGSCQYTPAI